MKITLSSLLGTLNTDQLKKAGDASDKSYQATTTDSPAYIHANRICAEVYDGAR